MPGTQDVDPMSAMLAQHYTYIGKRRCTLDRVLIEDDAALWYICK